MNGAQLKEHLFDHRGETNMNKFATFLGKGGKDVESYFRARKHVNQGVLRSYAMWKGYDIDSFMVWANGPVKPMPENIRHGEVAHVNETTEEYKVDQKKRDEPMMTVLINLMEIQKEQNAIMKEQTSAMNKLADAALLNAQTISKLSGEGGQDNQRLGKVGG